MFIMKYSQVNFGESQETRLWKDKKFTEVFMVNFSESQKTRLWIDKKFTEVHQTSLKCLQTGTQLGTLKLGTCYGQTQTSLKFIKLH